MDRPTLISKLTAKEIQLGKGKLDEYLGKYDSDWLEKLVPLYLLLSDKQEDLLLKGVFQDHLNCKETFQEAIELEIEEGEETIAFDKIQEVWSSLDIHLDKEQIAFL